MRLFVFTVQYMAIANQTRTCGKHALKLQKLFFMWKEEITSIIDEKNLPNSFPYKKNRSFFKFSFMQRDSYSTLSRLIT